MIKAIRERLAQEDEGFTLIELLVVVIIIGILAAIAIPTFLSQRERGWQAELTSAVRNAALEVEADITAKGGTIPADAAGDAIVAAFQDGKMTLAYTPNGTTGFTICGEHNQINAGADHRLRYLSLSNGLQDFEEATGTTC